MPPFVFQIDFWIARRKPEKAPHSQPPDNLRQESFQDQRNSRKSTCQKARRAPRAHKPNAKSTLRFNTPRQKPVCPEWQRLIWFVFTPLQRPFNPLFLANSSAYTSICLRLHSRAGNTKTMETARMWHSEILLSWPVSLFLNKALHGVSSAHECVPLPLSSPLFSAVSPPFFSHRLLFIPLYSSTHNAPCLLYLCFAGFKRLLVCSFAKNPTTDTSTEASPRCLKPLADVVWMLLADNYLQRVCWACCLELFRLLAELL